MPAVELLVMKLSYLFAAFDKLDGERARIRIQRRRDTRRRLVAGGKL